jgi:hypothetical protein
VSHIFVDETKRAGYVIAAVTVTDTEAIRKVVRALVLPGQRRIHMKHEQARRRRIIVSALAATEVQATVYDAARRYRTDLAARTACLTALVEISPPATAILGLSSSRTTPSCELTATTYSGSHARPALLTGSSIATSAPTTSCSLPLPDIVASSWVRSGEWRRRISPILTTVRTV